MKRLFLIIIVRLVIVPAVLVLEIQGQTGSGEWIEMNGDAPWEARAGLQAVYLNQKIYLMGGRTPNPPSEPVIPGDSRIWNDVWSSDDLGTSWEIVKDHDTSDLTHWPARAYFQAVTMGEYMYVLGGQNFKSIPNPDCDPPFINCSPFLSSSDFFNDVWRSRDGLDWELMTDSAGWSGRAGFSCVVYNDEIYVFGGSINDDAAIVGGPPARIYLNDVWKSSDGSEWELLADNAPWHKRAGGIAAVKDNYIYLLGGEEGFLCFPGSPCPPYFNDVWRSSDGTNWEEVTPQAPWKKRPGHQVVVIDNMFVLFGGFGLSENIFDPFAFANPRDLWISEDGADWTLVSRRPWNALTQAEIKYDFDALSITHPETGQMTAFTFGGDRESFDYTDPTNYLNVDNDAWQFCLEGCAIISASPSYQAKTFKADLIYPSPARDQIRTKIQVPNAGRVEFEIVDFNGRIIKKMSQNVVAGTTLISIDVNDQTAGMYYCAIRFQDEQYFLPYVKQ